MQIKMFDETILESADLVADSPKKAYYKLKLISDGGQFAVEKESGIDGRELVRRRWVAITMDADDLLYQKKLREKLNPTRKSPRKYKKV